MQCLFMRVFHHAHTSVQDKLRCCCCNEAVTIPGASLYRTLSSKLDRSVPKNTIVQQSCNRVPGEGAQALLRMLAYPLV